MTYQEITTNPKYEKIGSVMHSELKQFLSDEIEKQPVWAKIANMFQITGFLVFVLGGFKAFMPFFTHRNADYLLWMFYGLLFTFTLLIIFHELLHALAYYFVGAKKIGFGVLLRKFIFYVTADKFIADRKQFTIVALTPAIAVAIISIIGMAVFYQQEAFYFFIPVFGLHAIFCGGDFALLCFFQNRKDQEVYTFDVKEEGKTYFYRLKS